MSVLLASAVSFYTVLNVQCTHAAQFEGECWVQGRVAKLNAVDEGESIATVVITHSYISCAIARGVEFTDITSNNIGSDNETIAKPIYNIGETGIWRLVRSSTSKSGYVVANRWRHGLDSDLKHIESLAVLYSTQVAVLKPQYHALAWSQLVDGQPVVIAGYAISQIALLTANDTSGTLLMTIADFPSVHLRAQLLLDKYLLIKLQDAWGPSKKRSQYIRRWFAASVAVDDHMAVAHRLLASIGHKDIHLHQATAAAILSEAIENRKLSNSVREYLISNLSLSGSVFNPLYTALVGVLRSSDDNQLRLAAACCLYRLTNSSKSPLNRDDVRAILTLQQREELLVIARSIESDEIVQTLKLAASTK